MLLPDKWIENSIETYTYHHTTNTQIIYWIVLISISILIISLPFIYIDISIPSKGIVRPTIEKIEIKSTISEKVDSIYIKEGEKIHKGDTILCLCTKKIDYKIINQQILLNDYKTHITDLNFLVKEIIPAQFHSHVCHQEYIYFKRKKEELINTLKQKEKEYLRNKSLFESKVISEEEFDNSLFQYEQQQYQLNIFIDNQLSIWQTNLNNYHNLYNEANTILKQEIKNRESYVIKSPINGTFNESFSIHKGSNLQEGELITIISPDSKLCLEVEVKPKDIGYIYLNMPINIQIESFNYNEWGTLSGKVKEISSDFLINEKGNPYYKIKCETDKDYLTLKNGQKGFLKKGMNATVHFILTKQSLFNLLYQKMDNWINPSQYDI